MKLFFHDSGENNVIVCGRVQVLSLWIYEIFDTRFDSTRNQPSHRIFERICIFLFYTESSEQFFCFIPSRAARLITRTPFFNPAVPLCDLKQISFFSQFCRLQKDSFVFCDLVLYYLIIALQATFLCLQTKI